MKAPQELFESSSTELYLSEIQSRINSGEKSLELDFSQCQAVSAYTLARLISLQKEVELQNVSITLCGLIPSIRTMIQALHLDKMLKIT